MNSWFSNNWLKLVAIVMVLGAFASFKFLPYAYYQLMNWVVVGASLVTVFQALARKNTFAVWLFALVAVVFNPVAPIYLRSDVWQVADISAAVLFIVALFAFNKPLTKKA